jgi:hypothetical protein
VLEPPSSQFCSGYFGDGGLANYLPSLASIHDLYLSLQVARITGVSHWCLAEKLFNSLFFFLVTLEV